MMTVVKKVEINQAVCELSSKTLPNPFKTTKMYGTIVPLFVVQKKSVIAYIRVCIVFTHYMIFRMLIFYTSRSTKNRTAHLLVSVSHSL